MVRVNKVPEFFAVVALFGLLLGSIGPNLQAEPEAPSALSQIVLNLPPQQVVGNPWVGSVQILLLDENSDLLTDYDLSADPITLAVSSGAVSPAVISDSSLFFNGIVDLSAVGLRYTGRTGTVTLTASSSGVVSGGLIVTFNGCDVIKAVDLGSDTVSTVYSGVATRVAVLVGNVGDLDVIEPPSLRAFFNSRIGSVKVSFEAGGAGQVDTVAIGLPTTGLAAGIDTLMLVTESIYRLDGADLTARDTLRFPVQVIASGRLAVLSGSLDPDSVYAGVPFDLSLSILADGMQEPFDSAVASIALVSQADSILASVFDGTVQPFDIFADTLAYRYLPALIDSNLGLSAGRYATKVDYRLHVGGLAMDATESLRDSITILDPVSISYTATSLTPTMIASGAEAHFRFEIHLDGSTPIHVDPNQSYFELSAPGFITATRLRVPGDTLPPGNHPVETQALYVPNDMLGTTLTARASIASHHPGVANQSVFATSFAGQTIEVQELPLIQIVEAFMVAPNAPQVNTGQGFQIAVRLANVSAADSEQFELVLATDGDSEFDSLLSVTSIAAGDTVQVYFDVTAAVVSNAAEVFIVEIPPFTVDHLLPLDNIAIATVQWPAELVASAALVGADGGRVDVGEGFDLLIGLVNSGEGDATAGRFRINTNGVYLGLPDSALTTEVVVPVDSVRPISFIAPSFDTQVVIDIDLVERPIDMNTGLPAPIGDTAFKDTLAITSTDVVLMIELAEVPSNLVVAGESKVLFRLRLTNSGRSSVSDIELQSMTLRFHDGTDEGSRVRSLVEVGSTGLYDEGQKITRATAGGDRLNLLFDDYVVAAGQTVELGLRTKVRAETESEFSISLEAADVAAVFAAGPLGGQVVIAAPPDAGKPILHEVYTSVAGNLEHSFAVRTNPWDPLAAPAEFRYYLEQADRVRFLVLTLAGEIVFERMVPAGQVGARAGENTLFWEGRSNRGSPVLNGVYMVVVSTETDRVRASLKLAVIK